MAKTLIRYRREIDAAHQLPYHDGKCARLHGHHFVIEAAIVGYPVREEPDAQGNVAPDAGMLIDFADVKAILDRVLPDHKSLNHVDGTSPDFVVDPDLESGWEYAIDNPTAENFARALFQLIEEELEAEINSHGVYQGLRLAYVRVWETPHGDAQYPADPDFS